MILSMTKFSGNSEMDEQMLKETKEELDREWVRGPFALHELPPGSVVSGRFCHQARK